MSLLDMNHSNFKLFLERRPNPNKLTKFGIYYYDAVIMGMTLV